MSESELCEAGDSGLLGVARLVLGRPHKAEGVMPIDVFELLAPTTRTLDASAAPFGLCAKRNNAPERSASINLPLIQRNCGPTHAFSALSLVPT